MPTPHPTDRSLAALIDDRLHGDAADAISRHVHSCQRCLLRIGASNDALPDTKWQVIEPVRFTFQETADEVPESWDVWRLSWDATSVLGVIRRVDSDLVSVFPILDVVDADEWSALLDAGVTGGLGELAVSVALETAVPWSTLDARVARLSDTAELAALQVAFQSGSPREIRRGAAVRNLLDERIYCREGIADSLRALAGATWAPLPVEQAAIAFTFDELLGVGIPANRALAIVRGAAPDDREADAIEAATGTRPAIPPVDEELRRTIDQPRRKAHIRARANANSRGEGAERLALARQAQPELAAARGIHGATPNYDTILDRLLDG